MTFTALSAERGDGSATRRSSPDSPGARVLRALFAPACLARLRSVVEDSGTNRSSSSSCSSMLGLAAALRWRSNSWPSPKVRATRGALRQAARRPRVLDHPAASDSASWTFACVLACRTEIGIPSTRRLGRARNFDSPMPGHASAPPPTGRAGGAPGRPCSSPLPPTSLFVMGTLGSLAGREK